MIDSGATYTCSYTKSVTGDAGYTLINTTTAIVWDDDGNSTTSSNHTVVVVADVQPTITVISLADVAGVNEPGGDVTYTVEVQNTSPESTDLTSLASNISGNLNGQGNCAVGGSIPSGGTYACSFSETITGNSGDVITDTITAGVEDNENNTAGNSAEISVGVGDVLPTIVVHNTAVVEIIEQPGGSITFFVAVNNTSQELVTLTSLVDDHFGDLDGQGSCILPQIILPGGSYSCNFSGMVAGSSGDVFTNVITASAQDDENNIVINADDATVTIINQSIPTFNLSKIPGATTIPEPGGLVTFTIQIQNTYAEELQLTSLIDDTFGDLDGQGTCSYPREISDGSSYTCTFSATVSGNAGLIHTNIVTAQLVDEGPTGNKSDTAAVTITDVLPSLLVTITAGETEVVEPGENVAFTVEIENTSVEEVSITSLIDNTFGDLHGQGSCAINNSIAIGGSYTCSFNGFVSGDGGDTFTNTVSATIEDDEGNQASETDTSSIDIITPTPVEVSGQVRNDTDFDGSLTDPDGGIPGLFVELSDGICVIGFTCPVAITNTGGYYTFDSVFPGSYLILETDPNGYVSTADSQGANDNRILLTVISGVDMIDNIFLDTNQTASIRGQVRDDRDGDGDLGDGDSGLAGVTIELPSGNCVLGVDCRSTATNSLGYFEFNNVIAGDYIIVENDLPDYYSTADTDIPNDNRIRISLIKGVDSNANVFLDSVNPVSCIAPDPADGFVSSTNPADGQIIPLTTTTLSVEFNQAMATSGGGSVLNIDKYSGVINNLTYSGEVAILSISYHALSKTATLTMDTNDPDWLPGSEYQLIIKSSIRNACGSKQDIDLLVIFFTKSGITGQVRNDLDADGNLADDDQGIYGVTLELIQAGCSLGSCPTTTSAADGSYLFSDLDAGDYTIYQYDLPGFTSTADLDGGNDNQIEVTVAEHEYPSGRDFLDTGICSVPDPVNGFVNSTDPADGQIIPLTTSTLSVEFNQSMATSGGGSVLDNGNFSNTITNLTYGGDVHILSVSYHALSRTATLTFDTNDPDWLPGSEYQLKVISGIKNACDSNQGLDVLVSFFTKSGIAGQVRNDVDVDGDLADVDQSISGVTLELVQSGCSLGSCPTTTSAADGSYLFADLDAGDYTIYQYDLPGFTSTADLDGGNDNQIAVTIAEHEFVTGRDFLDSGACSAPDPVHGFIISTNPANGSILVSMSTSSVIVQFDQPMSTEGVGSVLNLANFHDKLANLDLGGDVPFTAVEYDGNNNRVTLYFDNTDSDWQPGSTYEITIGQSIENACKVKQDVEIKSIFETTSAISGQVRKDLDGDGSLTDNDPGLMGVSVELSDGSCRLGLDCRVAATNTSGFYIFPDVATGNYSLYEYNPAEFTSTADSEGANNDMIFLNLQAGPPANNNDFLDTDLPLIEVTKEADFNSVGEGSQLITYSVIIENISVETATLISISDDMFGNLDGQGTCMSGESISSGSSYSCSFSQSISGNAGENHTNTIFAAVQDLSGKGTGDRDSATVSFQDVLPTLSISSVPDISTVDPTGQMVLYTVHVNNLSPENVELIKLDDTKFGNLDSQGTCVLPQTLAVGGSYTCTFAGFVSGNIGDIKTNETKAEIQDDEGNRVQEIITVSIDVMDILPTISVTNNPDASTIDPPTDVNFDIQVRNTSPEPVTLHSLVDDKFGDLNSQGNCDLSNPPVIPAFGGIYGCSFMGTVSGSDGESHINLVTAGISDDEGNLVDGTASATIDIVDSLPSFILTNEPDLIEIEEPGGSISYTVSIKNTSPEPITLISPMDDLFGDLSGDCTLGGDIEIGQTYTCIFTRIINGDGGDIHTNTITINVQDDDGNLVSGTASASVEILEVIPSP